MVHLACGYTRKTIRSISAEKAFYKAAIMYNTVGLHCWTNTLYVQGPVQQVSAIVSGPKRIARHDQWRRLKQVVEWNLARPDRDQILAELPAHHANLYLVWPEAQVLEAVRGQFF